jgi:tetratricopeptide (TPR) repeat protein
MLSRMDAPTAEGLLEVAERAAAGLRGPASAASLDRLEAHYAELLEALDWLADHERPNESLRLANALYGFWIQKQRFEEGSAWFGRALRSSGADEALRGTALINAGFMPFWLGRDEAASTIWREGLETGRRLGNAAMISQALAGLARVALRSDVAEARRLAHEALDASEAAADPRSRSNAIHLLGVGAQMAGDLLEAQRWMTQRLALVREDQNEFLIASEAGNLSMVERQLGNLDAAEALVREALEIADRRGDEFMKPFAFSGLAAIATNRAEFERAATLVGAAEARLEAQGAAWPPDERVHYEWMLVALPEAMGAAAFDAARASGRRMTSPEAVAFALAAPPPGQSR